ncbi:hypothetical protein [Hymenobacter pini]|uniref:hypothetical protein n=1 Tax=Hymenobacter pini TaxID=2880879 RepID=UPI001CF573ED|nr:hypothetical protein [Hymenobacter pini]MCA8830553.1 hypothetical protein [Hymenobacter pini]
MAAPTSIVYRITGLLLLTTLVLVVLVAAGRITMPYWMALIPIWGTWVLCIAVVLLVFAVRLLLLTVRRK